MGKIDQKYSDYLNSEEWQRKREVALERARYRCQLCNSKGSLQVHHRTYERIFKEDPEDLTVLCNECHCAHHKRQDVKKARHRQRAANRAVNAEIKRLEEQEHRKTMTRKERKAERLRKKVEREKRWEKIVVSKLEKIKKPLEKPARVDDEEERPRRRIVASMAG